MPSTVWVAGLGLALCATPALAQVVPTEPPGPTEQPRISATWAGVPIADVLRAFSDFSGKTIVTGESVTGSVTADIKEQPWDVALRAILSGQGLIAIEDEYGIIRVDNIGDLNTREAVEPIVTRVYRISFSRASELQATIAPLLSPRGSVSAAESTNSLIVSDIARVQRVIARLLGGIDWQEVTAAQGTAAQGNGRTVTTRPGSLPAYERSAPSAAPGASPRV